MADTVPDDGPLTLDQAYAVLEVSLVRSLMVGNLA